MERSALGEGAPRALPEQIYLRVRNPSMSTRVPEDEALFVPRGLMTTVWLTVADKVAELKVMLLTPGLEE
jgi:hypothetical protein